MSRANLEGHATREQQQRIHTARVSRVACPPSLVARRTQAALLVIFRRN